MSDRLPILDRMAVLADVTRGRLLLLLERRELTVSEVCAIVQAPQSTVSRHLRVLADGGWVVARRDGTSRCYSFEPQRVPPEARRLWTLAREELAATSAAREDARRLTSVLARRRARSQAFFSSSAGEWDRLRRELFGRRSEVEALLGLLPASWAVGDLGCGTGRTAEAMAPFVRRVIAVDGSEAMLAAAQRRLGPLDNVELRRGDLEALPVEGRELDAALLLLVLHHVVEPGQVLAEVARALVPGGRLLVVDMVRHDREEYRAEMGHAWLGFERDQLGDWLAGAGFVDFRLRPLPPDPEAKGPTLFTATARTGPDTLDLGGGLTETAVRETPTPQRSE